MSEAAEMRGSRTATIVDPEFMADPETMSLEAIRDRRDQARAELEFQSYLRRLIQVRQDILLAERTRRERGQEPQSIVERLTVVLAEGPRGRGRGEALRFAIPEADVVEAARRADDLLAEVSMASPESMSEDRLEDALAALDQGERRVSADRAAVIRVVDRLQEELKRRYREDPSQIPRGI